MANTGQKFYQVLEQYYVDTGKATGVTKYNLPGDPDYIEPSEDLETCPLPDRTPNPQFVLSTVICVQAAPRTNSNTHAKVRDENTLSLTYGQYKKLDDSWVVGENNGDYFPYGEDVSLCPLIQTQYVKPSYVINSNVLNLTVGLWADHGSTQADTSTVDIIVSMNYVVYYSNGSQVNGITGVTIPAGQHSASTSFPISGSGTNYVVYVNFTPSNISPNPAGGKHLEFS